VKVDDVRIDAVMADRALTTVVLVEGVSDAAAVEAFGAKLGHRLPSATTAVVPIGGATNIARVLARVAERVPALRVKGLYDSAEERLFARGLERAGLGHDLDRRTLAALGFHVCVDDLEDELIRAVGPERVVDVITARGELRSFRSFQAQPAQRDVPLPAQLHRFMGTRSGRKEHYAAALVDALAPVDAPLPLQRLLEDL
jgi:hypothetical protein